MAKKSTVSPAVEAEHLKLKDEMVSRVVDKIGGPLGDTDKTLIEMAVFNTLGDLGITLPFTQSPASSPKPSADIFAGAALTLLPYERITDDYLDQLVLDKTHSETSIVSLPEQGGIILTKPLSRLILALRMTIADHG